MLAMEQGKSDVHVHVQCTCGTRISGGLRVHIIRDLERCIVCLVPVSTCIKTLTYMHQLNM